MTGVREVLRGTLAGVPGWGFVFGQRRLRWCAFGMHWTEPLTDWETVAHVLRCRRVEPWI